MAATCAAATAAITCTKLPPNSDVPFSRSVTPPTIAPSPCLRNILFNGRIASLPPVSQSRKGTIRLIRPLVYVTEDLSTEYARLQGFLPIACVCSEKESVRRELRAFLDDMKSRHIGISDSITAAMGNVNLYTLMGSSAEYEDLAD